MTDVSFLLLSWEHFHCGHAVIVTLRARTLVCSDFP